MKKFKDILNYLLFDQSMSQLSDKTQIDVYTKSVCSAITDVINASTSKFKTSIRVIFRLRRNMQSDTNSSKSSSKIVSRRARRSKDQHRASTSCLKKSESYQKTNHSKDSSNHSSKRRIQCNRRCSKNVKINQMSKESLNVVQIHHFVSSSLRRHHDSH
jgi:hypothetical protein